MTDKELDEEIDKRISELRKKKLKLKLSLMIQPNYSIGVHGITPPKNQDLATQNENFCEIAEKIMKSGLKTFGWGGLLSNVQMFGQVKDLTPQDWNDFFDYRYYSDNEGNWVNIVVAIPDIFIDKQGIEYYLGHFQKSSASSGYAKGGYGKDFPINKFVDKKKYLPKEFIIGYFYGKFDKLEIHFIPNPEYIGIKSLEQQSEFFEKIKEDLISFKMCSVNDALIYIKTRKLFNLPLGDYFLQLSEYYDIENSEKTPKL